MILFRETFLKFSESPRESPEVLFEVKIPGLRVLLAEPEITGAGVGMCCPLVQELHCAGKGALCPLKLGRRKVSVIPLQHESLLIRCKSLHPKSLHVK